MLNRMLATLKSPQPQNWNSSCHEGGCQGFGGSKCSPRMPEGPLPPTMAVPGIVVGQVVHVIEMKSLQELSLSIR